MFFENTAANEVTFFILLPFALALAGALLLVLKGCVLAVVRYVRTERALNDKDKGVALIKYLSGDPDGRKPTLPYPGGSGGVGG